MLKPHVVFMKQRWVSHFAYCSQAMPPPIVMEYLTPDAYTAPDEDQSVVETSDLIHPSKPVAGVFSAYHSLGHFLIDYIERKELLMTTLL